MDVGPGITAEFPVLTDEQVAIGGAARNTPHPTAGEVPYAAGDRDDDFIVTRPERWTSCDRRCPTPPRP
jgi:hypothetical protein